MSMNSSFSQGSLDHEGLPTAALTSEISNRRMKERDRVLSGEPETPVSRLNNELIGQRVGQLKEAISSEPKVGQ